VPVVMLALAGLGWWASGGAVGPELSAADEVAERAARASVASEWRVVEDESMLTMVALRAGPAARLAHDHLVRATRYYAVFEMDPDAPSEARFEVTVQAAGLQADRLDDRARVEDRLIELGILDGPFQSVSESQREDIREEMLARGQLDADRHPTLRLRTVAVERLQSGAGADHPWRIRTEVTIRDRTAEVELRGRLVDEGDGRYRIEAYGPSRFTEFDIEPYSAFFGAVRNRDRFYFYLDLVVERAG